MGGITFESNADANAPHGEISITGGPANRTNRPTVGGIYIGQGGTNDWAFGICAGTSSKHAYLDSTYPTVDHRGRILYSMSLDYFRKKRQWR